MCFVLIILNTPTFVITYCKHSTICSDNKNRLTATNAW